MSDFFARMFALDTTALTLVILICMWGFMIMRTMMPIAGLAVASFPLLVLGALAAHALLEQTYFVAHLERGPGLAVTTGIGMIAVAMVIVALARLVMLLNDAFGARPHLLSQDDR